MVTTYVTDPLAIATEGLIVSSNPNIVNTLAVAVQGFLVTIEEEIIEVVTGGHGAAAGPYDHWQQEKKKKKRITAIVFIDGQEYRESIEVDDIQITAKDIKVEIQEATKPQLKLTVIRG